MSRRWPGRHVMSLCMNSTPEIDRATARRLSTAVPRYTSYPTAPHFSAAVDGQTYANWLGQVPEDAGISLYVHVPYCDRLCWFCACATKQIRRYEPVERYLKSLHREIEAVSSHLRGHGRVTALHFGGGSPTMLKPEDIVALSAALRKSFHFDTDAEISVEIDPNDMDQPRHEALAAIGMTRASLGVQDFDEKVQKAINREQTFEQTKAVIDAARAGGATSVNVDLLYGLPHQTVDSVEETLMQVLTLSPDRIALFGYAHVPWMKKHQTMIDEDILPDTTERFRQSERAARVLQDAAYNPIGIDHFAKPDDSMAEAARDHDLRRNFQGYTTDAAEVMIALGASAIGKLPQGYVQNMPATGEYERIIDEGRLATIRGFELSKNDVVRAWVIEKLMCDFGFSADDAEARFGASAAPVVTDASRIAASDTAGLFLKTGSGFRITEKGRPFTRLIASEFDSYFGSGAARHSSAV